MDKLERFVRIRTKQVEDSHFQYALRQFFDAAAQYYKKMCIRDRDRPGTCTNL